MGAGDWIDVGHARLAYRRVGRGPDLVFIHGWPLHSETYRHVLPSLTEDYTCHLIDLPGAGGSTWTEHTRFSLQAHAETMATALHALKLDRYMLVAHDSGAGIARLLAADDPRVVGLISGPTEIPGHDPWLVAMYRMTLMLPGGAALIGLLMGVGLVLRSPFGFAGCFRDPRHALGEFRDLFIAPLVSHPDRLEAQLRLLASFRAPSIEALREAHGKIDVPVRLVLGTDDGIFPIRKSRAMMQQFAGPVTTVEIPGARAFLHEDHPNHFAAQILEHAATCFSADTARAVS